MGNYHTKAVNQLWKALPDDERKQWVEKAGQTLDVGRFVFFFQSRIDGFNSRHLVIKTNLSYYSGPFSKLSPSLAA